MRVLVTGATGFLGNVLVDRLIADGLAPVALVRASSRTDRLEGRGVPCRVADLHSGEGVEEALRDVDAVVHAAGGGHVLDVSAIHADTTETTATLLSAVATTNPALKRFVLVSSLAAHGPSPSGRARDASESPRPITHYGRSKAAAEAAVLACADQFPVTIARPSAIYGPGDWRMAPLYRAAERGWVPLPASSRTASMVHVRDCASAISAMVSQDHASGRIYFVDDGAPLETAVMARIIGDAVGRRVRVLRVPGWALRVAGVVSEGVGRLRGRAVLFHRDKVRELLQPHWICDSTPLREELGWRPEVTFEEGALETAADYRTQGLLR